MKLILILRYIDDNTEMREMDKVYNKGKCIVSAPVA